VSAIDHVYDQFRRTHGCRRLPADLVHKPCGLGGQIARSDEFLDESKLQGLPRGNQFTTEQQILQSGGAGETRGRMSLGVAEDDAQLADRDAEARIVRCDPHIASRAEFAAAADGHATPRTAAMTGTGIESNASRAEEMQSL
jgi:hypothetical protein